MRRAYREELAMALAQPGSHLGTGIRKRGERPHHPGPPPYSQGERGWHRVTAEAGDAKPGGERQGFLFKAEKGVTMESWIPGSPSGTP